MIRNVGTTVDAANAWAVTASSTPTALINAGTVAFAAPTGSPMLAGSYKAVTTGSYVGNGGTIALNTYLGTDASPSDQLVVNGGSASGTTALKVANTTGLGVRTLGDGIAVIVAVNGASAPRLGIPSCGARAGRRLRNPATRMASGHASAGKVSTCRPMAASPPTRTRPSRSSARTGRSTGRPMAAARMPVEL